MNKGGKEITLTASTAKGLRAKTLFKEITAAMIMAAGAYGCASAPEPTTGPNGRIAYSLSCSGWGRSMADCLNDAGTLCAPSGYDVVAQDNRVVGTGGIVATRVGVVVECR